MAARDLLCKKTLGVDWFSSLIILLGCVLWISTPTFADKPTPDEAVSLLRDGNARFVKGESLHPRTDHTRLTQAGAENQGDHAYATVITCSDSRVPVERIFDAGVMDIFVIRVAGNVCDTDEVGSIEYGLAHVNTPVLVVLGHTQCGAVTAVTAAVQGHGHALERNIPPLVDNIQPAVERAIHLHPDAEGSELIEAGIEQNVYQSITDLFHKSPATRELVKAGKAKVVGAIYDVGTGNIRWLDETKSTELLAQVETDPSRALNALASGEHEQSTTSHTDTNHNPQTKPVDATNHTESEVNLSSTGTFAAPPLPVLQHVSFGAEAGHVEPWDLHIEPYENAISTSVLIGLTILTVVLTILLSLRLAKIKSSDGTILRGFTIGTKLTLTMGILLTLLLTLGTFTMHSQDVVEKDSHRYTSLMVDIELLSEIELDVLNMQLSAQGFISNNSDEALTEYSNHAASALDKIRTAKQVIKEPEHLKIVEDIEHQIVAYDQQFIQIVRVTDEQNAIINGQLDPTIKRLDSLLHAVVESAEHAGDTHLATVAADALNRLSLGRAAISRFIRTAAPADAAIAEQQVELGEHELTQLIQASDDPSIKHWLSEADQGYQFYIERNDRLGKLIANRQAIIHDELLPDGQAVMVDAEELIGLINQEEEHLQDEIDASTAAARVEMLIIILISVLITVSVTIWLIRNITTTLSKVLKALQAVSVGDLTNEPMAITSKDEMGELARATDRMSGSLKEMVSELTTTSEEVTSAATEISASSEEIATGGREQESQLSQIASAIEQMSAAVAEVAQKASEASTTASRAGECAQQGGMIVSNTVEGMHQIQNAVNASASSVQELGKRGDQIGQIIAVINDIADQTNLLALNAAIEAARAGEHGRGFAVVADEVRKLADRTTTATEEVGDSIKAIQQETSEAVTRMQTGTDSVEQGMQQAAQAGDSLQEIVSAAGEVATMIQSIAAATEQQSSASEEVSRGVENVAAVARQASEATSQAAVASTQLSSKAEQLLQMVGRFKV